MIMNTSPRNVPFRHGALVFTLPVALMVSGCAATSSQRAASPAAAPNPMFTITLHCEPGALDEDEAAARNLASADTSDQPYECFSLPEAMQDGAETMAAQARYERSSTR